MTRLTFSRALSAARGRPGLAVILGVGIATGLGAVDWAAENALTSATVVLAPFVAAAIGGPRTTLVVALYAVLVVVLSGAWNENFGDAAYLLRVAVVVIGAALAMVAVLGRAREALTRRRFGLLAAISEVADGTRSPEETFERLNELIVPLFADVCVFDVEGPEGLERTSVRAVGPRAEAITSGLCSRTPTPYEELVASGATSPDAPGLVESGDEAVLRGIARDPGDLELLRSIGFSSTIVLPLTARGRRLGQLMLNVTTASGRRYDSDDFEFAQVLAGRAALALDNAGLFSELETVEAQLAAALGGLAEAVTVQAPTGRIVYANAAAARSFGFASPDELLASSPQDIVQRFESYTENGEPLRIEDLPGRHVLAGRDPEPLVVRSIDRATGAERWSVTKATAVRDARGAVKLAVNVIEDITEVKRAELAQRVLARIGEILASSLEWERTLQGVADLAVPELADWCAVILPDGHGNLRQVAVAHADPAQVAVAQRLAERYPEPADSESPTAIAIRDGRTQIVGEVTDAVLEQAAHDEEHLELLRGLGLRAGLVVPMVAPGGSIGAIALASAESRRTFSRSEIALAEELARRAGTAVENARLYRERSHIARTLQRGLLPPELPDMAGWRPATLYRPAGVENWVGGDFYDAFAVEGGWIVLVGDVAGHGPEAAALTAQARYTLRTAGILTGSPVAAVTQLNRELAARPTMALCTVACALLRETGDGGAVADVLCAGHPLPLRVREGRVEPVGTYGPMVGAWENKDWGVTQIKLEADDVLVLYTDGVIDTAGPDGRFGEDRLEEVLRGTRSADEAVVRIDSALSAFAAGDQSDDTAVLAVARVARGAADRLEFAGGEDAPRAARHAVAARLAGELSSQALYDLQVLVSEVTTNAVRHGGARGPASIVLDLDVGPDRVRVTVHDPGPGVDRPERPMADADGVGGRGFVLLDGLARNWGAARTPASSVWFEIDRQATADERAQSR